MAQPRAVTTSTLRPRAAVRKHWRRRPPRCVSKPTACTVLSRGDASTRQHCQHHRDARDARERLMQAGTTLAPWPWLAPRESAAGAVVSGAWLGKNPSLPLATLLLRSESQESPCLWALSYRRLTPIALRRLTQRALAAPGYKHNFRLGRGEGGGPPNRPPRRHTRRALTCSVLAGAPRKNPARLVG